MSPANDNIQVGPHPFAPLRLRDRFGKNGACRGCYVAKAEHPVECWVPARPLGERVVPQRTFIYCPGCRWELVAGGLWLGQEVETGLECYRCARCGTVSVWDFDLPGPVRVR